MDVTETRDGGSGSGPMQQYDNGGENKALLGALYSLVTNEEISAFVLGRTTGFPSIDEIRTNAALTRESSSEKALTSAYIF